MRKNLKRSWLVVSKLTWEIWQILTHALKSLKRSHFNRLLLTKVCNVWAKKVPTRYLSWHPKSDAKFEEKLTCGLKHDMRNLSNFHQGGLKIGTLIGIFFQSRECMSLKFSGELCVMTVKNDVKFEDGLTCQFKIDMRKLTNFYRSTQKSKKICTLMGYFLTKVLMGYFLTNVCAEKVKRFYVWWYWILMQNLKEN